jgi:hypothetical protein
MACLPERVASVIGVFSECKDRPARIEGWRLKTLGAFTPVKPTCCLLTYLALQLMPTGADKAFYKRVACGFL